MKRLEITQNQIFITLHLILLLEEFLNLMRMNNTIKDSYKKEYSFKKKRKKYLYKIKIFKKRQKFNKELIYNQKTLQTNHKLNNKQKIFLLTLVQQVIHFVLIKWKSMESLKNRQLIPLIQMIKHKYLPVRSLIKLCQKYKEVNLTFRLTAMFIKQINLVKVKKKQSILKMRRMMISYLLIIKQIMKTMKTKMLILKMNLLKKKLKLNLSLNLQNNIKC